MGLILSGGNIDARLLASLLVRELVREKRIVTLRIAVADQPGFLARAAAVIADTGANIIEVHHFRSLLSAPAREAVMEVTLETRGPDHADLIVTRAGGRRVPGPPRGSGVAVALCPRPASQGVARDGGPGLSLLP